MRIATVKPDWWGIRGGFEVVLERIEADLRSAGHDVERVEIPVAGVSHEPFGIRVGADTWQRSPEWFTHFALLEQFRELTLPGFDLALTTQPPSYAVRHPRTLALFYHHARAFYDLEDVWVAAGRAPGVLHHAASAMLREAEWPDFAGVTHFLAGSNTVAARLERFHGRVPRSLYSAPAPLVVDPDTSTYRDVLTVSRHEFTKRTELVVQALASSGVQGDLVGDGGRLPFVREIASRIATGGADGVSDDPTDLWLNTGEVRGVPTDETPREVRLRGRVTDAELESLYRSALCVVAPAYDEDYGLTVLEAMAHARPVVVCRDGGGLTELVVDGVNGFVVEPTGKAIAEAVALLAADRALARRMGAAALESVRDRTPEAARRQLLDSVERVMGSAE